MGDVCFFTPNILSKENLFQRKKSLTPTGDQTTAPTDGDEGPKLVQF